MRHVDLARAALLTSGRAAALRAVPLACAVGIGATVVFGGSGMRASDAVAVLHASAGVRASLFALWIALATPAAGAAFDAPGTRTLRSLRPPRTLALVVLAIVTLAQAPWVVLFACGDGLGTAFVQALLASAACSFLHAGRRSRRAMLGVLACAALVVVDPRPWLAAAPAAALAYAATRVAWATAFDQRGALRIVRRSPPPIALASAYVARMARTARARLEAAAALIFAGAGALALSLRNDPDARPVPRALLVLAFPVCVACSLLAAPAIETEALLLPLLRSTRTKPLTLTLATALALAAPATALAGTATAVAAQTSHAPHVMTVAAMGWTALVAAVVAGWARRASRARSRSTFLVGAVAIAALFTAAAAAC